MGWTMEQLFRDGIMPREMCCPKKQEYKDTMHLLDELESDMKKELTKEQADLLENYKEYFSLLATLENEECFIQGMALGTRLTAEAFLSGKDNSEEGFKIRLLIENLVAFLIREIYLRRMEDACI